MFTARSCFSQRRLDQSRSARMKRFKSVSFTIEEFHRAWKPALLHRILVYETSTAASYSCLRLVDQSSGAPVCEVLSLCRSPSKSSIVRRNQHCCIVLLSTRRVQPCVETNTAASYSCLRLVDQSSGAPVCEVLSLCRSPAKSSTVRGNQHCCIIFLSTRRVQLCVETNTAASYSCLRLVDQSSGAPVCEVLSLCRSPAKTSIVRGNQHGCIIF
ncbi:hypothetical protein EVAR_63375_1 [Eumeta japonica]|uniref:Uncharacterized protein n=1 Tax=Eumeta variegata TaxID=151549 RepID=A0A4C1YU76_EUMVA|nr:hypothetical protein EVAR_63375_1 [Eumeta japonica]